MKQNTIITLVIAVVIVIGLAIAVTISACSNGYNTNSYKPSYVLDTLRNVDIEPDTIITYDTIRFPGIDEYLVDTNVRIVTYAPIGITKENWEESYKSDVQYFLDNQRYAISIKNTQEQLFNKYFVVVKRYNDGTVEPNDYVNSTLSAIGFDNWKENTELKKEIYVNRKFSK